MRQLRLLDYWDAHGIYSCHICCGDFSEDDEIHVDHNWPKSLGGTDDPRNLMPAHALCNIRKNKANPWEYLPTALAAVGVDFWKAFRRNPQGAL